MRAARHQHEHSHARHATQDTTTWIGTVCDKPSSEFITIPARPEADTDKTAWIATFVAEINSIAENS